MPKYIVIDKAYMRQCEGNKDIHFTFHPECAVYAAASKVVTNIPFWISEVNSSGIRLTPCDSTLIVYNNYHYVFIYLDDNGTSLWSTNINRVPTLILYSEWLGTPATQKTTAATIRCNCNGPSYQNYIGISSGGYYVETCRSCGREK